MSMIFPPEFKISRDTVRARHEFFEEFPTLRKPFTTQIDFWARRLLMTEQNKNAAPSFTLNFMNVENREFVLALEKPEYDNHHIHEAADVGVVGFIAPAFWSSEAWKAEGIEVVRLIKNVIELSGLSPIEYAEAVDSVIRGKNDRNYIASAFVKSGNKDKSTILYQYTTKSLKDTRNESFNGKMPADAHVVYRHRNNGAVDMVAGDKRYEHLLSVARKIDRFREKIGVNPIS